MVEIARRMFISLLPLLLDGLSLYDLDFLLIIKVVFEFIALLTTTMILVRAGGGYLLVGHNLNN